MWPNSKRIYSSCPPRILGLVPNKQFLEHSLVVAGSLTVFRQEADFYETRTGR
jgi:hypothetical protein